MEIVRRACEVYWHQTSGVELVAHDFKSGCILTCVKSLETDGASNRCLQIVCGSR